MLFLQKRKEKGKNIANVIILIDDHFPLIIVNMVTDRMHKGKLASQVERQVQEDNDDMETEEESYMKKHFENYFCLRCEREIKAGE